MEYDPKIKTSGVADGYTHRIVLKDLKEITYDSATNEAKPAFNVITLTAKKTNTIIKKHVVDSNQNNPNFKINQPQNANKESVPYTAKYFAYPIDFMLINTF